MMKFFQYRDFTKAPQVNGNDERHSPVSNSTHSPRAIDRPRAEDDDRLNSFESDSTRKPELTTEGLSFLLYLSKSK